MGILCVLFTAPDNLQPAAEPGPELRPAMELKWEITSTTPPPFHLFLKPFLHFQSFFFVILKYFFFCLTNTPEGAVPSKVFCVQSSSTLGEAQLSK